MKIKKIDKIDNKISNFIFNLRNKYYVRKNSITKSKITLKNHKTWVKNFFKRKNILFIIMKKEILIGYVRLELEKKKYNVSWALTKNFHGKGFAKKSLRFATKNKLYKYKALINKKNVISLKVASHSKFKSKMTKNNLVYLYKN